MSDRLSKKTRSKIMSSIRSKNTKPELLLKEKLKGSFLRYQPKILGRPDFASKKKKIAIFIDGCFWHKCPRCYKPPASNEEYWIPKLDRNAEHDKIITEKMEKNGWTVLRFWEHEILENLESCVKDINDVLKEKSHNVFQNN